MTAELRHQSDGDLTIAAQDLLMRIECGREHLNGETTPDWFVSEDLAKLAEWKEQLAEIRAEQARRAQRD